MGIGARAACLTILVGSSSVANARALQLYDGPDTPVSASAGSGTRALPASDWTQVIGPSEHPIRLSLDGPNSAAVAPRRPIRTTLDALPEPPSPATPPLPSPEARNEPPPAPAAGAGVPATTTLTEVEFETRRLRLSLEKSEHGAIGGPSAARPIRLQLDAGQPPPAAPRPYRSTLE